MRPAIYVLSHERFETAALALAGICGFNRDVGDIIVMDDGSKDPRLLRLYADYAEAGLVDEVVLRTDNEGIGPLRRAMFEHFLENGAPAIVQVEADMLLCPGAIAALVEAFCGLHAEGFNAKWLCTHQHDWCHTTIARRREGKYDIGMARSGSEPFWMTTRNLVARSLGLLPAARPDLVPFLQVHGATVLYEPEIQCQHIGAVNSFYYPQWGVDMVTYYNADGSMRQPYLARFKLDFHRSRDEYPALYRRYYERLRDHCPVELPALSEEVFDA